MRAVEYESLAARQLAAAAYEEVGTLAAGVRANTSLLNALRETQVEQGRGSIEQGIEISAVRESLVEQGRGLIEQGIEISAVRETLVEQGVGLTAVREALVEQRVELNAFRETQVEQGIGLNALRETQIDQGLRLDLLESEVRTGFAMVGQGMSTIVAMLENITPEN